MYKNKILHIILLSQILAMTCFEAKSQNLKVLPLQQIHSLDSLRHKLIVINNIERVHSVIEVSIEKDTLKSVFVTPPLTIPIGTFFMSPAHSFYCIKSGKVTGDSCTLKIKLINLRNFKTIDSFKQTVAFFDTTSKMKLPFKDKLKEQTSGIIPSVKKPDLRQVLRESIKTDNKVINNTYKESAIGQWKNSIILESCYELKLFGIPVKGAINITELKENYLPNDRKFSVNVFNLGLNTKEWAEKGKEYTPNKLGKDLNSNAEYLQQRKYSPLIGSQLSNVSYNYNDYVGFLDDQYQMNNYKKTKDSAVFFGNSQYRKNASEIDYSNYILRNNYKTLNAGSVTNRLQRDNSNYYTNKMNNRPALGNTEEFQNTYTTKDLIVGKSYWMNHPNLINSIPVLGVYHGFNYGSNEVNAGVGLIDLSDIYSGYSKNSFKQIYYLKETKSFGKKMNLSGGWLAFGDKIAVKNKEINENIQFVTLNQKIGKSLDLSMEGYNFTSKNTSEIMDTLYVERSSIGLKEDNFLSKKAFMVSLSYPVKTLGKITLKNNVRGSSYKPVTSPYLLNNIWNTGLLFESFVIGKSTILNGHVQYEQDLERRYNTFLTYNHYQTIGGISQIRKNASMTYNVTSVSYFNKDERTKMNQQMNYNIGFLVQTSFRRISEDLFVSLLKTDFTDNLTSTKLTNNFFNISSVTTVSKTSAFYINLNNYISTQTDSFNYNLLEYGYKLTAKGMKMEIGMRNNYTYTFKDINYVATLRGQFRLTGNLLVNVSLFAQLNQTSKNSFYNPYTYLSQTSINQRYGYK